MPYLDGPFRGMDAMEPCCVCNEKADYQYDGKAYCGECLEWKKHQEDVRCQPK